MSATVPRFSETAARLVENGYEPLPLWWEQKNPCAGKRWQDYEFAEGDLKRFKHAGTGLLCGRIIGVDIDVRDAAIAAELERLAEEMLGRAPRRIGQAPKVLRIYQAETPFPKVQTRCYRLAGDSPEDKAHKVEILAQGQQFVAFNIHPDTGEPYTWNGAGDPLTVPIGLLPAVSEELARKFITQAEAVLARRGRPVGALTQADDARAHEPNEKQCAENPQLLREALEAIPNPDLDYDDWIRVCYAVKGALGDEGLADFMRWSAKSTKDRPELSERTYRAAKPERSGAGSVYHFATLNGWKRPARAPPEPPPWMSEAPPLEDAPELHAERVHEEPVRPARAPLFDRQRSPIGMQTFTEAQLPPQFIVEGLKPCDIGARVGAGGTAKSTLGLWEAVHIIMGWKLYGRVVLRPGRVLIVSSEDTVPRIRFRLRMICEQIPDLTEAAKRHIADSLLVEDLTGKGVRLVQVDAEGNLTQTGAVDALIDAYAGAALSLVNFDPLVYFGPGERFVNDAEAAMAQAGHRICNGLDCAVEFTHHTGKANAREGRTDQYSNRGGSALPDGMRYVQVLTRCDRRDEAMPAQFSDEDIARGRALALHVPKITDAPPITAPIWIRRTGWRFEHLVQQSGAKQDRQREAIRRLYAYVVSQADAGIRHTGRTLEAAARDIGMGRNEVRSTLHAALELKHLIEHPLPDEDQHGRRKSYLAAGLRP